MTGEALPPWLHITGLDKPLSYKLMRKNWLAECVGGGMTVCPTVNNWSKMSNKYENITEQNTDGN